VRRTLVWKGVDAPRMEIAHVEVSGERLRARGTQIGSDYELRYDVEEPHLQVEVVGGPVLELELAEDRDHFDLANAPLFNSLPALRHGLHRGGQARDFVMSWVTVPDLEVHRSEQRYEPIRPGLVRYRGSHRADVSSFDLEFDEDGFVVLYPGLAERIA
jgi:Putative glycolipid-binding